MQVIVLLCLWSTKKRILQKKEHYLPDFDETDNARNTQVI